MKLISYLKKYGVKHTIEVVYIYKLEIILEKMIYLFTKNMQLKDAIIIESHNDFDCNGGAFYKYLLKHNYNEKYKIIWLIRRKINFKLPYNVTTIPLYGPNFRKAYYICTSKYIIFDCECVSKPNKEQIMVYCGHGTGGLKNVKGKLFIPPKCNYVLAQSENYAPIQADQWSIDYPNKKIVYIGYPAQDVFFDGKNSTEINKITQEHYSKVILWMPTFRRGGGYNRNDSTKEQKFGIPLIDSLDQYKQLNNYLKTNNVFLVIKIHPKQDLSNLGITDQSNIKVLTGDDVKELGIDNYELMKCCDALISDYSGAAYEYLQLDKPIGYVLDDIDEYISGFVVDDIHQLIAGQEIYNYVQFEEFLNDIICGTDKYKEKRQKIRNFIYKYHDDKSSERLARLLNL